MNKIGPNPHQSLPENSGSKSQVIAPLNGRKVVIDERSQAKAGDTVALSNQATDLSALEAKIKQLPDIDAARVVALHNQIMAGEYRVDSQSLAEKLMDLEHSLDR